MRCPVCNSKDIVFKCHHNNRKKKIPIDIYYCKQCKDRFNVEGDKSLYNHKGNLRTRKHLCNSCFKVVESDNDTERILNCHIDCLIKVYEKYFSKDNYENANDFLQHILKR